MRDKIGNFLKNNNNIDPHIDQGFHSLRQIGNANESGSTSRDPYLGNVEFILKFEEGNGSQNYKNSIPIDKWFLAGHSYTDKSGSMSPGYVSVARSRFGNGSYFNNTCHPSDTFGLHGLFYTDILSLGYEDFTLECWVNFTTLSQNNSSIFWLSGGASAATPVQGGSAELSGSFNLYVNSSGILLLSAAGQTLTSGTTPFVVNTWHHVALVRKNGILRVFVDGTARMSSIVNTNTLAITTAETGYCFAPGNLKIFGIRTSNSFYGDEVRLTRNVSRYWDNFSAPTSEFPTPTQINNPNIIALMKFDDPDIVKNSCGRSKDIVRLPAVTTSDKKFGVSSLQPNSYPSFHQLAPSTRIRTGDFNISCWIKPTAKNDGQGYPIFSLNKRLSLFIGGYQWAIYDKSGLVDQDSPFDGRLSLVYDGKIIPALGGYNGSNIICQTAKNTVSLNVWQHILVSRKNNIYRIFVNGVLKATGYVWKLTPTATPSTTPTGFAYGNNIYVATTSSANYSTSDNGTSWTARSMPSANWQSLIYENNRFTTIGYNSNIVAHSTDGINWTTATLPQYTYNTKGGVQTRNAGWFRVAYGNNTYVAIGVSVDGNVGQKIITSTDGTTWTTRSLSSQTFTNLIFANGEFLITTSNGWSGTGSRIYRSSNGITWTSTNSSFTPVSQIAYGNNTYVTVGSRWIDRWNSTIEVRTSSDLSTFTTITMPRLRAWNTDFSNISNRKLIFLNNKFYLFSIGLVGNNMRPNTYALVSEDGINWDYFAVPGFNLYVLNNNGLIGHLSSGYDSTANIITPDGVLDINTSYLIIGGYGGNTTGDVNRGDWYNSYYTTVRESSTFGGSVNGFYVAENHLTGNKNDRWAELRMQGFIDEFIIDTNTGVDTNFTPPTTSLTDTRYSY